jgi:squalene-hopene/tetraprenyl-beta-curcumene cyclase
MHHHRGWALGSVLLSLAVLGGARAAEPAREYPQRVAPSADEPNAAKLSLLKAGEYLDSVAVNWTREHKCGSCHTNYPYLVARPALKETAPAMTEVRRFFEDRVAHWDTAKPRWDTEVVATGVALAFNDAATTGKLHPLTRTALDRMWTVQQPSGAWNWLKCNWPPFEYDDYYGATYAAVGVGIAPDGYAQTDAARDGLAKLRKYFKANPPPNLHHKTMLLWASLKIDGLMMADEQQATIKELLALQRADGGWCLPSLGQWKRRDSTPNDKDAPSDGYGTGFVVYVLRQAGLPADDAKIQRGVAWLRTNQRASGRWYTRSLNDDKAHYITDAGSAFAVLALESAEK